MRQQNSNFQHLPERVGLLDYATRFATFTLAMLEAIAYNLWSEHRKALRPAGKTP